jgi:hypothetical protein
LVVGKGEEGDRESKEHTCCGTGRRGQLEGALPVGKLQFYVVSLRKGNKGKQGSMWTWGIRRAGHPQRSCFCCHSTRVQ